MTWEELSEVHWDTVSTLYETNHKVHARAVCGRAYYSAYALVTSKLQGIRFGRGWNNPEHVKLPSYIDRLSNISKSDQRKVKGALRRLRQRREDADYRPGVSVLGAEAAESLRDVTEIRRILK